MSTTTTCKNTGCAKAFKIIPQEKQFYEAQHLPEPDYCPTCRHKQRMALRSERALYPRVCRKCEQKVLSTIPESAPYTIYCQTCFWANIG